jgi:hypothetical protein
MEGNLMTQIIGVMRIAPETQDFCEVGNLEKKKLVNLKTARPQLGLIYDSACGQSEPAPTNAPSTGWLSSLSWG